MNNEPAKPLRKLILYIAMSLDGYIAGPGDNLDFLNGVAKEGEDYGYAKFISSVDTVILGRKTYDWVTKRVAYPHADKTSYILTRSKRESIGNIHFYSGDIPALVHELKGREGKNIFCDGGAEIVNLLMRHDLIDEFILSVIPVFLGEGTKLFQDQRPEQILDLHSARQFESGLVQLHYLRASNI